MEEFIEELKNNQNVKGTETIRIDYVIERLKDIQNKLLKETDFFEYHSKNLTNAQYQHLQNIEEILEDKGVFKNDRN